MDGIRPRPFRSRTRTEDPGLNTETSAGVHSRPAPQGKAPAARRRALAAPPRISAERSCPRVRTARAWSLTRLLPTQIVAGSAVVRSQLAGRGRIRVLRNL